jgi:hypothetical protein
MATARIKAKKAQAKSHASGIQSGEQQTVLSMYSNLSRWEKNAVFLLLQSLGHGALSEETDGYSWPQIAQLLDLSKEDKPAAPQGANSNIQMAALEQVIEAQSVRLASVVGIIELCMNTSEEVADALHGARDILEDANSKIAQVEGDLHNLRKGA